MWHIVQRSNFKFGEQLKNVTDLPYTISYLIRKRIQIDSWMELPKEHRPPESIWDSPSDLEEWFERTFSGGKEQTEFNLPFNENEIEE